MRMSSRSTILVRASATVAARTRVTVTKERIIVSPRWLLGDEKPCSCSIRMVRQVAGAVKGSRCSPQCPSVDVWSIGPGAEGAESPCSPP